MVSEITRFYCKPSSWFHRQGALHTIFDCRFWKGDPDYILVLHCNHTSIVHRFRFNKLFMFAGNDNTAISSLGGASCYFWLRILKGRPRLYIHIQLTLFVYLEQFRRYSTFLSGWDFPTGDEIVGILGTKWLPKLQIREGRALPLRQTGSFEPLCVKLSLSVWPVQVRKKKGRKAGRKEEK